MDKFVKLTGVAAPLPVVNIDTDMIIPKDYLKTIKRTGLGKGVGASRPDSLRAPRDHGPPAAQIEFLQIHCLAPRPALSPMAAQTRWPPPSLGRNHAACSLHASILILKHIRQRIRTSDGLVECCANQGCVGKFQKDFSLRV